jgi:hydroxymethylglutaryl-CoA reductase
MMLRKLDKEDEAYTDVFKAMVKLEDKDRYLAMLSCTHKNKNKNVRMDSNLQAEAIADNASVPQKIVEECLYMLKEDSSKIVIKHKNVGSSILDDVYSINWVAGFSTVQNQLTD